MFFNPLQKFLRNDFSNNDGQNYLEKKRFQKNLMIKISQKFKKPAVSLSAISQIFLYGRHKELQRFLLDIWLIKKSYCLIRQKGFPVITCELEMCGGSVKHVW